MGFCCEVVRAVVLQKLRFMLTQLYSAIDVAVQDVYCEVYENKDDYDKCARRGSFLDAFANGFSGV